MAGQAAAAAQDDLVPGEIVVRFKDGRSLERRVSRLGGSIERRIDLPGVVTMKVADSTDTAALAERLERRPEVEWAEPNVRMQLYAIPNDPRMGELWGMNNGGQIVRGLAGSNNVDANVSEAWDYVTGGDAVVAVGDSGVAMNHPDLQDNIWNNPGETGRDAQGRDKQSNGMDDDGNGRIDDWRGWDFINNDNDPSDDQGHGTHVAGTIGAVGNNGQGISGVNQRVKIMPLKIGSNSRTDTSINGDAAAAAMLYAGNKGAKIFNGSFGGGTPTKLQEDAIAANPNTLFVFAAGNSSQDNDLKPSYPCNFNRPNIICVASINNNGAISSFSNYGVKSVHLGAPGGNILSTAPFSFVTDEPFETPMANSGFTYKPPPNGSPTDPVNWGVAPSPVQDDGTKALMVNGGKGHPPNTESAIFGPRINLASCTEPVLEMEASVMYANGSLQIYITDNQNDLDFNSWRLIDQGSQVSYTSLRYDLSKIDHNNDGTPDTNMSNKTVSLIFLTSAGQGEFGTGPLIDSLKISCKPNVFTGSEFQYMSGTSMASPMVAGAAGLVASQFPAGDMNYIRNAILSSVTPMPSLASKTIRGGALNALGAIDTKGPNPVNLKDPAEGSTTTDTQPTFNWDGTNDDKTGVSRYELKIDGRTAATTDGSGRSAKPGSALAVGSHQWKVDAVDGAGQRTSSATKTVVIAAPPVLTPSPAADTKPPRMSLGKPAKRTRKQIAASGFQIVCTLGEPGTYTVEVTVSAADAKKLGLKPAKRAKTFVIAKGRGSVGRSGKATIKVKPSAKIAKAIRRARRKATFTIKVVGADAAGNKATRTAKLSA